MEQNTFFLYPAFIILVLITGYQCIMLLLIQTNQLKNTTLAL